MIQVRNNAVLTTPLSIASTGAIIQFDTTVLNTNSSTALSSNTIQLKTPGVYKSDLTAVLSNAGDDAVTVVVSAYADGEAVTGATATVTVASAETETVNLSWISNVILAMNSIATISWYVSGGAIELENAQAIVYKMI